MRIFLIVVNLFDVINTHEHVHCMRIRTFVRKYMYELYTALKCGPGERLNSCRGGTRLRPQDTF